MPKKKRKESQEEQSARFRAEVEKLVAAGELSPTEAEEALDKIILQSADLPDSKKPPARE